MKEKVWIFVSVECKEELSAWKSYYSYETENVHGEKVATFCMITDSQDYRNFVDFLFEKNIHSYVFRREYKFTKKDMENAEILWFWTDDDAHDSYIPGYSSFRCSKCGIISPLRDRHNIHVDYKKIKKYDIMSTYNGDEETIVSEQVKQILEQHKITGVGFEPIYQIGKENQVIEGFYHLLLQDGIGDVIEPSIIEKGDLCPECGMYNKFICKTTLNFDRKNWSGLDICYTRNWFGGTPKFKNLIISNKLFNVLKDNKIKNVYFQPAYFVD